MKPAGTTGWLDRLGLRRAAATPLGAGATDAELRAYFNQAASDEENYPASIDPRILHVRFVLEQLAAVLDSAASGTMPVRKRVADLGCGKGRFARLVQQRYPDARVIALDIAEAMLRHVPTGCQPLAASLTALPLASESIDGAYATESLEHAVDIEAAVAEIARVVRPGGRIVIIDKNAQAWGRLETPEWERWFDRRGLEQLLGKYCRVVRSQPISYWQDVDPDGLFLAWVAEK